MVPQHGKTDGRSKIAKAASQPGHGSVSAAEIEKFTAGIDYPCDKEELLDCAAVERFTGKTVKFVGWISIKRTHLSRYLVDAQAYPPYGSH